MMAAVVAPHARRGADRSKQPLAGECTRRAMSAGVKPLIGVDAWIREAAPSARRVGPTGASRACSYARTSRVPESDRLVTRSFLDGPATRRSDDRARVARAAAVEGSSCSPAPDGDIGQAFARASTMRRRAARPLQALCGDRIYLEVQRTGRTATGYARRLDLGRARGRRGRDQRRALPDQRRVRGSRSRGASTTAPCSPTRRSGAMRGPIPQEPLGDGGVVRRRAGTHRHTSRWPALLPGDQAGRFHAARLSRARRQHHRGLPARESERGMRRRLGEASALRNPPPTQPSMPLDCPGTRRHLQHGLCGVLPDRGRLHRWRAKTESPWTRPRLGGRLARGVCARDHGPRPIEHDLLFERFLNPERVSMPDFDVDFCMEGGTA